MTVCWKNRKYRILKIIKSQNKMSVRKSFKTDQVCTYQGWAMIKLLKKVAIIAKLQTFKNQRI